MKHDDKPDQQMSRFKSRWSKQFPSSTSSTINQVMKKAANAKRRRRDRKAVNE